MLRSLAFLLHYNPSSAFSKIHQLEIIILIIHTEIIFPICNNYSNNTSFFTFLYERWIADVRAKTSGMVSSSLYPAFLLLRDTFILFGEREAHTSDLIREPHASQPSVTASPPPQATQSRRADFRFLDASRQLY
jgi:hypothetical protein